MSHAEQIGNELEFTPIASQHRWSKRDSVQRERGPAQENGYQQIQGRAPGSIIH
jgi:hypothetical protein